MEICAAEPEHLAFIAENMRQSDVDQLWATAEVTPELGLKINIDISRTARVVLIENEPVAAFGVVCSEDEFGRLCGSPWLLATDTVERHRFTLCAVARAYLKGLKAGEFDNLLNYVDARDEKLIKWLRWLGFEVHEPVAFGPFDLPFCLFEWHRN